MGPRRRLRLGPVELLGLAALWGLAAALRLRALPLVMTLGDSLGPWWVAWRGWWSTTPHAPPYGRLLALPHALIVPFARSLWEAEAALLVLHAVVAPIGALLAAQAAADRRAGRIAGLCAGGLLAVDPGLIDTALSGAEGYLGAAWLGLAALLAGRRGAGAALGAAAAFTAAVHNHPLALGAAPLLWQGGWARALGMTTLALLSLGPRLVALAAAAGPSLGDGAGAPGGAGPAAVIGGALDAALAHGGPATALLGIGALVGLLARSSRRLTGAGLLSLGGVALLGAGIGGLRDHHLRLLGLPLAAGWAGAPRLGLALALLLLRPAPDPLARPGAWARPSTLGLTHALGDALIGALRAHPGAGSPLVDGVVLAGAPAAEPGGLVLDLLLRGEALATPAEDAPLVVILSFDRARPPSPPAGAAALRTTPTAALWRLDRAGAAAWRAGLPAEARVGGAVDGLVLIDPGVDTARAAW
jgi:hypothetical protein